MLMHPLFPFSHPCLFFFLLPTPLPYVYFPLSYPPTFPLYCTLLYSLLYLLTSLPTFLNPPLSFSFLLCFSMSYFFSMLLPLQVAVLSSPGPLLPGHLLLISELASSQWDPGRGPNGPAEWRGEGVWVPCMVVGFRRSRALVASCCALHWVRLMPMCSPMALPHRLHLGHHVLLLALGEVMVELG